MNINDVRFLESSVQPRSPVFQGAADAAALTRRLIQRGEAGDGQRQAGMGALLGYAQMKAEQSAVDPTLFRRWIERALPAAYPGTTFAEFGSGRPWLYAASAENCEPLSGEVARLDADGSATWKYGLRWEVIYRTHPWLFRADGDVLSTQGWLSAGGGVAADFPGKPARPDEGDALRRGWLSSSRYVARYVQDQGRTVSLPQGMMRFDEAPGGPDPQPVPVGYPFPMARSRIQYVWMRVPAEAIPFDAIGSTRDRVNDQDFDVMPAGTAMLTGADWRLYQGVVGDRWYADVTYTMMYAPNRDPVTGLFMGWNSWPRVFKAADRPSTELRYWPFSPGGRTTSRRAFAGRDFTLLFNPPQTGI